MRAVACRIWCNTQYEARVYRFSYCTVATRTKNCAIGKFWRHCDSKMDDQSKLTMAVMVNVARADTTQLEVAMHMMMNAQNRDKKIPWKASWMIFSC